MTTDYGHLSMPTVLITGASGYVGSRLCGLAPRGTDLWGTRLTRACPAKVNEIACDLADERSIRDAVSASCPDLVFHLAYDPARPEDIIAQGTRRLLAALESRPGCRIVFLSTDAVFDGTSAPNSEEDEPRPLTAYGRAKRAAEEMVLSAGGLVARTSLVYGFLPPDPRSAALASGLRGAGFPYPFFTDEIRSPVWVDDLCHGLWALALLPAPPEILHLAGPEAVSRHGFARRLALAWGLDPDSIPAGSLADHPAVRPADTSLASGLAGNLLGYSPRTVEQAVRLCKKP